ncbi:MAG TPA: hypothetical protein VNM68_07335 [Candidatus Polarisedimenticolia bacterium]|nr:hypothetical protein [Candidatus Polarisedimenticolia bacterium]
MIRAKFRAGVGFALLVALAWGGVIHAQQQPSPTQQPPTPPIPEETQVSVATSCVEPAPMLRWQDYQGPFARAVGVFARKLERKSVHAPHYKPGAVLCTLELKDKFILFAQETLDPVTFLNIGFDAGIDQAQDLQPSYGQGAAGYGKRFGADLADQASSEFFKDVVFSTAFSEDPRYYRLRHGPAHKRFLHAIEHAVVAYRENGAPMFNYSEWLGTTSAVVLSNVYRPDNKRGFTPAARRVGFNVATDAAFDVLREFWPEIARKFHLPFRGQQQPEAPEPGI